MSRAERVKSLVNVFSGKPAGIDLARGAQRLRYLVQKKLRQGEQLTPVEIHLYRNLKPLSRNSFGPSFGATCLSLGQTLLIPVSTSLLLFGAAVFIVRNSSTYTAAAELAMRESAEVDDATVEAASAETVIADTPEDTPQDTAEEDRLAMTISSLMTQPAPKKEVPVDSLVPFLSGVIAIHQPGIVDCGKVARDIAELSKKKGVDPFLVASIIATESRFHVEAKSSVGAVGLMQVLPSTGKEIFSAITGKKSYPTLTDTRTNIALGIEYLKQLEKEFYGNRYYALAAYNWGAANVHKSIDERRHIPLSVSKYASVILERTTRWQRHFHKAEKSATAAAKLEAMKDKDVTA